MAKLEILRPTGEAAGKVELSEALFGVAPKSGLMHQVAMAQLAGRRTGTADTLTRGEVTGGGRKPWRQKGTGRARQGSRTAPHWKGGGVVFGPHPRQYTVKVNDKVRRQALRGALSAKAGDGALRVVAGFELDEIKTKALIERLDAWKAEGKVLLVLAGRDANVERSAANLRAVRIILADSLNVVDVLEADTLVFTVDALKRASEVYA